MSSTSLVSSFDELKISKKVKTFILKCLNNGTPIEQIGYEFEKTKADNNKKKDGQFYTPRHIVDYIISYLSIDSNTKVIDPACGCGAFVVPILKKLKNQMSTINSVYGIDIDKKALEVLSATIHLLGIDIKNENLINGNTIVSNKAVSRKAMDLKRLTKKTEGFDVVIGNPPYATLKKEIDYDSNDKDYAHLLMGQVNAATLMIAKGLSILKPNGVLAFVLPKNILHVDSYAALRMHLLNETTILHLVDLRSSFKNVRGEQIILFVQKKKPSLDHEIDIKVCDNDDIALSKCKSIFVKQKDFIENNKIHVFKRNEDYLLINKLMKKGSPLETVVYDIFRGGSISKEYIIEPGVNKNKSIIPYIRGRNIQKFLITPEVYVSKKNQEVLQKQKFNKMLSKKKIIVQNIFSSESGLICGFDYSGFLTNETVTNILVDDKTLGYYLLGLLNTKISNYYLIFGCYNCSKMTMHTDKKYIGSIPVVFPHNNELLESVINISKKINYKKNDCKELRRKLDKLFYKIYDLDQDEIQLIDSGLDLFLSEKSRW